MDHLRAWSWACAVVVGLGAAGGAAAATTPGAPRPAFEEVRLPPPPPTLPRRFATAGVQLDVNYQFDAAMKRIYDRNGPFGLGIFGNVLFDERVGVGISAGLQRRQGTGVAPEVDGEAPLLPEVVLWQVPVAVEGWLRMALVRNQPVVPYLRAGGGVVLAWERVFPGAEDAAAADPADPAAEAGADDGPRVADALWFGCKVSVHGAGGVQIRLPFPEIQWEGTMAGPSALSDIYLHIEGWARAANNFSRSGVDLSAVGASAGITVMF
jgi:hypothetical protein